MRAGKLRHRINLLRPVITQNSYGEDVTVWSTDKPVWASIDPLRGDEYYEAMRIKSNATYKIRIRYTTLSASTLIGPKCKIEKISDERQFNIVSPPMNFQERNIYLDILCSEAS